MLQLEKEYNKLYIICGNYNEYIHYNLKNNLPPDTTVYVNNPEMLRGLHIKKFIFFGTYFKRKNINEIYEMIRAGSECNAEIWESTIQTNNTNAKKEEFEKIWNKEFNNLI
jgi:hypothetical protein